MQPSRYTEQIITRTERIELDDLGIVVCTVLDNSYVTEEDARENIDAVQELANGKSIPVLVDIRRSKGISKEARAFLASADIPPIQCACALLVESAISRVIGSFFLGLNKTHFPLRLFTNEQDAREWLQTFL